MNIRHFVSNIEEKDAREIYFGFYVKRGEAKKWQINSIRTYLLKIGAIVKKTKRRIYYRLSKAFVHQELFYELIFQ